MEHGGGTIIDLGAQRRRRGLPAGRTLHLVDLENLAGGSAATQAEIEIALDGYERGDDHRVVACGIGLVFPAKDWAALHARRPTRTGPRSSTWCGELLPKAGPRRLIGST